MYRAIGKVTVQTGDRVKLSDEQAFNARHLVELPAADGYRNVLRPFDIKPGAAFGYAGTLPKNLATPIDRPAQHEQAQQLQLDAPPAAAAGKRTRKA